jgi:hypothetical protein
MNLISLTYAELAERLGISADGARMKVKRAKWTKMRGNDGAVRVLVPDHELSAPEPVMPAFPDRAAEQARTLEAHIATLTEQLAKAESRADSEREKVADLTAQLLRLATDMMTLQQAQARPWWKRLAG